MPWVFEISFPTCFVVFGTINNSEGWIHINTLGLRLENVCHLHDKNIIDYCTSLLWDSTCSVCTNTMRGDVDISGIVKQQCQISVSLSTKNSENVQW